MFVKEFIPGPDLAGAWPGAQLKLDLTKTMRNRKAEPMLKRRSTAVRNRRKVNMHIFVVFTVVSCKSGQNAATIRKSQNAPNVARRDVRSGRASCVASQSPLRPTTVSSIALVLGDSLRIC